MDHGNIFAINKLKGPTSHDVIDQLRRITSERRIGHAGTLDPLASGVLVVGIGREATRQLATIVAHEKEYIARIRLGATSTTDDAEGIIQPHPIEESEISAFAEASADRRNPKSETNPNNQIPKRENIERVVSKFVGHIEQIPPAYSAIKIAGTPAHRRVRRGETVELKPRIIEIKSIEILEYEWPEIRIRVVCGPGVYIRALARDIGAALGVGGYIATLERTRVGNFTLDRAQTIDQFREHWSRIAGEQCK